MLLLLLQVIFVTGFRLQVMYISFSIRSSLTYLHDFQLLVLLSAFIEITFFCLYQQNKSSESKVKFRQASNHCKRVFEAAKLTYANKRKEFIISQKLGSQTFGELPTLFSTKANLLYLSIQRPRGSVSCIKQNCLLKTFL